MISLVLSLLSIIGLISSWVYFWITTRRNVTVMILDYVYYSANDVAQLVVELQNLSRAPISISAVSWEYQNTHHSCELFPKIIQNLAPVERLTPQFPLNLSPCQGILCYLEFLDFPDIQLTPGKTVDLEVYSNRGPIRKSIPLPQPAYYLHKRS